MEDTWVVLSMCKSQRARAHLDVLVIHLFETIINHLVLSNDNQQISDAKTNF